MKELAIIILTVAGGLGTFLLGMKHLSEGLQAVGGKGLKRFMELATTHRLAGVATGLISTSIVQSSSIITVMAVGFVSSGLMNLQQAVNVIIGSNIGTTTTAWLIAFAPDTGLLGLGAIGLGGVFYFFIQKETFHNAGLALMGLGFIFMGLHWMNVGVTPLKTHESARALFASLTVASFGGLIKCFLISLVFTAVVQSSSATTALVITLATQGILPFDAAAATVFGMNVGTTVTAWFAAVGGTTEARRTALAHTLFNVVGVALLMPLFVPVILPWIHTLFKDLSTPAALAAPIAAIHTSFNVVTAVIFLPFTRVFAAFVTRLVPAKTPDGLEKPHLSFLNPHVKQSPAIACAQAFREVCFMSDSDLELMETLRGILSGTAKTKDEDHVLHRESVLDSVQKEITEFLGRVMTSRLPVFVADRARFLLRVTDEFESVSDEAAVIVKAYRRLKEQGRGFGDVTKTLLLDIHDRVTSLASAVDTALRFTETESDNPVANAAEMSSEIGMRIREARRGLLLRLGSDTDTTPLRVLAELDILNAYDRSRGYYLNIAETLAGGKNAVKA